ncbi:thioredoxin domain-containing protein [Oceanobacillus senegalensis]|uniref:thioredoxin domain-containing protein n=1 Tax=Oceanobacillus senegalensis TaxID=1936063 RepID=UPI000A3067B8|nr:thioredoxin domain-containing protein [Oceanobacillus senegalensis]
MIANSKNNQLKIGKDDAPVKLEAFMNVACKGSASIYRLAKQVLPEYIESGKLQVIIKLYDKPREELILGSLVHWSLDYSNPEQAIHAVTDLLDKHPSWMELSNKELKQQIVRDYGLSPEERLENVDVSLAITKEAIEREITKVPTLFFNGEILLGFTYELEPQDLRNAVENALAKV